MVRKVFFFTKDNKINNGGAFTLVRCFVLYLCCASLSSAWAAQQQTDNGPLSSAMVSPATQPAPRTKYPEPAVRLDAARLRQFDDALAALSAQAKVAFIAEGAPLHPILEESSFQALRQALPQDDAVPLSKAVAQVSGAFGYEAVRADKDLFLLYKTYTDPKDLPFVTLEEAARSLRDIVRATEILNSRVPLGSKNDPFQRFIQSLAPQQVQVLRQRALQKDGVPIALFRPEQRQLMLKYAGHKYLFQGLVDPLNRAERAARQLEATRHKTAVFRRMDVLGLGIVQVFGFEVPSTALPALLPEQVALSHGFRLVLGGMSQIELPRQTLVIGHITSTPSDKRIVDLARKELGTHLPDTNVPTAQEYADAQRETPQPSVSGVATLQTVVERLNAAAASSLDAGGFKSAAVDAALQAKPVSIVGAKALAPERVLQALAAVYGLHLQHPTDGTLLLTLRPMRIARDYREIPETVRRFLPEPWERALVGVARSSVPALIEQDDRARQERGQEPPSPSSLEFHRSVIRDLRAPMDAQATIYDAAVRRLRARVEPRVGAAEGERLPMSQVGEEERRLLALLCSTELLYPLHALMTDPVPHTLADFNHAFVQGVFDPNSGELQGAWLCYRDENGLLRREFGGGGEGPDLFPVPAGPDRP